MGTTSFYKKNPVYHKDKLLLFQLLRPLLLRDNNHHILLP